jgi:outer membrane translocation and assembly module TamA
MSVTPLLKFAFLPQLSVAGGVGITELEPFAEELPIPSQMANVAIGSVRYRQQWAGTGKHPEHEAGATFTLRKGTTSLESDFSYDRYLFEADYAYRWRKQRVIVSGMFGRINGVAPLFERFTLGDSRTLRGWDKYDITPVGGDRMYHTSVEYSIHDVQLFLDAGSVWDTGTERLNRFSTGVGYTPGPLFMTLGFPINTDEFRAVFTMGFRFGLTSTGVKKY